MAEDRSHEARSHDALVGGQFGTQAQAYLTSAVHAQGPDLQALADLVAARPDGRVLDLGCGGGHAAYAVAPHARDVVAYDLSPEMLEVVAGAAAGRGLANVVTRQGRVEALPFEDAAFDMVVSRFSAHHWTDVAAGLREAVRVLKPGGAVCMIDTVTPGLPLLDTFFQSIELLRDPSHVRNYTRGEWETLLARVGLEVEGSSRHRLRLEFRSWVERMRTPPLHVEAIRSLLATAPAEVRRAFAVEQDGSFTIEAGLFRAEKPAG